MLVVSADVRNRAREHVVVVPIFSTGNLGSTRLIIPAGGTGLRCDSVSRSTPSVVRPDGSAFVFLEFQDLRESRTIVDKLTRVCVTLPFSDATRFHALLACCVLPAL